MSRRARFIATITALCLGGCAHAGRQTARAPLAAEAAPTIALTAPVGLRWPGWAVVGADIWNAPTSWCPTSVAWEFSDGVGGHAFGIGCDDREWSELHYFAASCEVTFRVFEGGRVAGEVMLPVVVGGGN